MAKTAHDLSSSNFSTGRSDAAGKNARGKMKPVGRSVWSMQKERGGSRFRAPSRKLHLQDGNQTRHRSHERSASSLRDRSGTLVRPSSCCFPEKEISRECLRLRRFAAFFENIIVDRVHVAKHFGRNFRIGHAHAKVFFQAHGELERIDRIETDPVGPK